MDADETIADAALGVDRSFIDNGALRPFARDIAKSFLYWALPPDTRAACAPAIEALAMPGPGDAPVIVHASASAARPRSSNGDGDVLRDVFDGNAAHITRRVGATRITAENLAGTLPEACCALAVAERSTGARDRGPSWLRLTVVAVAPANAAGA